MPSDHIQTIMHFFTIHLFADLDQQISMMLIIALILTFIYEFINGFHDTANSVTTVIYTYALSSQLAVTMSSIFNFLGVILSGLSVAYTIVYLFPIDLIMYNTIRYLTMIFSMLLIAIIWNLGTWYFGLPASSSHTLIGTIIGIGVINTITTNYPITKTLNIPKLIEIVTSLIISPLIGAILAGLMIFFLYHSINNKNKKYCIHLTPTEKEKQDGKRQPSFWLRTILILSAAGVSFSHGANDGQKGIGLIMLILIGVIPSSFIVNLNANIYDINCTYIAVYHLKQYYSKNSEKITFFFEQNNKNISITNIENNTQNSKISSYDILNNNNIKLQNKHNCLKQKNIKTLKQTPRIKLQNTCHYNKTIISTNINTALSLLQNIHNYNQLCPKERSNIRNILIYLANFTNQIAKIPETPHTDKQILYNLRKNLLITVEYAPLWIIIAIALSLSFGTVIGWRRITATIGQKIGKKEMTYAQGLSAQLTTGISISIASYTGMPVSTTHVLSSAVTGTMIAYGCGLQSKTIKNILLTWILTLPITIILTAILYWLLLQLL